MVVILSNQILKVAEGAVSKMFTLKCSVIIFVVLCNIFTLVTLSDVDFCGPDKYQCSNNQCIQKEKHCNSRKDCEDLSDEFTCAWNGYTWCNFCGTNTCGWHVVGFNTHSDGCGIETNEDESELEIEMIKSTSKKCKIQINGQGSMEGVLRVIRDDKNLTENMMQLNLPTNHHLGYISKGSHLVINLKRVGEYNSFIVDIRFIDCNPDNLPLNYDFDKYHYSHWSLSKRFKNWQTGFENIGIFSPLNNNFLVNKINKLVEFRSPVIIGVPRSCLTFRYYSAGHSTQNSKSHLLVTMINLEADTIETELWSTNKDTRSQWEEASVSIYSDADFDIGFISNVIDGEIGIDDIALREGSCDWNLPYIITILIIALIVAKYQPRIVGR